MVIRIGRGLLFRTEVKQQFYRKGKRYFHQMNQNQNQTITWHLILITAIRLIMIAWLRDLIMIVITVIWAHLWISKTTLVSLERVLSRSLWWIVQLKKILREASSTHDQLHTPNIQMKGCLSNSMEVGLNLDHKCIVRLRETAFSHNQL